MRRNQGQGEDARLSVANLPTNMLCGLVLLASELGVNCEDWFTGLRLNAREVQEPDARVSYRQAIEVIRRALRSLPLDGVGLAMGAKQNGGNFGLLGLAMKTAQNFGEAVSIGLTYQHAIGPLMDLDMPSPEGGDTVTVAASAPSAPADILPFLCEEMFSSVLMLARELAGQEFRPLRLDLAYPAPMYAHKYTETFECEVRFDQPYNGMVVDSRWMVLPFPSYNPVTSRQALAMCRAQLDALSLQGETTAAVGRQLRPRLRDNPQMADIAALLHLSERTLRRQLAEEGTRFTALHDHIRTQRALELLHDRGLTISRVGNQVGFTDVREFRRAFKRWTGYTPSEARERMA